jgi:YfaZ precursor
MVEPRNRINHQHVQQLGEKMKKFILTTLAAAAFSANAMEVGLNAFETATSNGQHGLGVSVSQKMGGLNVTGALNRNNDGNKSFNRWSATVGKELTKVGPVALEARAGVAYLDNKVGKDGTALAAGLGASMPLAKNVSLVATLDHQFGSNSVAHSKGNILAAGVKVGF